MLRERLGLRRTGRLIFGRREPVATSVLFRPERLHVE
jgi:hypothetical protein